MGWAWSWSCQPWRDPRAPSSWTTWPGSLAASASSSSTFLYPFVHREGNVSLPWLNRDMMYNTLSFQISLVCVFLNSFFFFLLLFKRFLFSLFCTEKRAPVILASWCWRTFRKWSPCFLRARSCEAGRPQADSRMSPQFSVDPTSLY